MLRRMAGSARPTKLETLVPMLLRGNPVHICTRLGMSETDAFPRGSVGTRTLTTVIGELCLTIKRFYLRSFAFICGLKKAFLSRLLRTKKDGKKTTRINLRYSRG